jgi:hypothetical protein
MHDNGASVNPPGDHPHYDPGDGRTQCAVCGKWVYPCIHSCKGIRVAPPDWFVKARNAR